MFECMKILEYIYEGVVEPSYKKPTRKDDNRAGISRKIREECASSNTYPETSKSDSKCRKRYIDHPKDISKLNCLINVPVHSSDKCKVLEDFVTKYAEVRPNKYHIHEPETKGKFGRHQDKNAIVQHEVYEIILQKNKNQE